MPPAPRPPDTSGESPSEGLIDYRYRLIEKIGAGGMATVFMAEDDRLGRQVAIKRLGTGSPEDASKRLLREARLGAALNHPNIVSVYDVLPDPDRDAVLIVMELVDGIDLGRDLLAGPPDDQRSLEILGDVAAALDHAHEHRIVHRDVKPSNVLLARSGRVKLSDLGIAKALEDTGITRSGVLLGSVPYMSPEQLSGKPVGPESDVYSLSLIAYELLSGERAHKGDNPLRVTHEALHEPPPDLRQVRPEIPASAARVIARALDPEPARRPVSACAFVRELKRGLATRSSTAESQPTATAPMPIPALPKEAGEPPQAETAPPSPVERVRSETLGSPGSTAPPAAGRRRSRWPVALTALALAGVVVVILVSSDDSAQDPASDRADGGPTQGGAEGPSKAGAGAGSDTPTAAATASNEPAAAVETFYMEVANGNFDAAFAATTPNLRAQLGGTAQFETLESIEFENLEAQTEGPETASVSFQTMATHTDRIERCTGSATVVFDRGAWLLDSIDSVNCIPV